MGASGGSELNSGCIRSVVPVMRRLTRYVCRGTRTRVSASMSKNGWILRRVGEIEAAARDLIAAALEPHVTALDLRATEQQRPIERPAQRQFAARDNLRLRVLDAQRRWRDDTHLVAERQRAARRALRGTASSRCCRTRTRCPRCRIRGSSWRSSRSPCRSGPAPWPGPGAPAWRPAPSASPQGSAAACPGRRRSRRTHGSS